MGVDIGHYHGWEGKLGSPWIATFSMVRVALLQVFRRKLYWAALGLSLLQFIMFWAAIYVVTQIPAEEFRERLLERIGFSARLEPGVESGYVAFMRLQSLSVMMLLAFSGSLLVGSDFRMNSMPFYLSRRIDRKHYIVGKLLSVSAIVILLTVIPALALFVEYGMFTSSFDYWLQNWEVVISILAYGLVLCVVLSIMLVTLSAYLQKTAPIAITWSSLFVMLSGMASLLRAQTDNPYWVLIDPWRNMRAVGRLCFDTFPSEMERDLAWWALAILVGVCAVALAALVRRVRAIEIVG
jgi:hypothetical protein